MEPYIFPTFILQTIFFIHFNSCLFFYKLSLNSYLCHLTSFLLFFYSSIFFSTVCTHLCLEVSITALFHSPPLQSNSRSFMYSLVFLLLLPRAFFFFINAFPSLLFTRCIQSSNYVDCASSLCPFLSDFFEIACIPISQSSYIIIVETFFPLNQLQYIFFFCP